MTNMTIRDRLVAALHQQETDRLPFAPKVFNRSYLKLQEARFQRMPAAELAAFLECDRWEGIGGGVVGKNPIVREERQRVGRHLVTHYHTPDGTLTGVQGHDELTDTWHPVEYPIRTPADLRTARHLFAHTEYSISPEALKAAQERAREVGEDALLIASLGPSPLMNLIQHWAGPQNTLLWLYDCREEMEALMALMHEDRLRHLRLLVQSAPTPYIMSVENTSTTLVSPTLFRRYCLSHLRDYNQVIRAHGKHHLLHQCGKLKALLPDIASLPALGIEALSSPPVGDTTWADAVRLCPGKAVLGGTCASLWLRPVPEIVDAILTDIATAATTRGLILTSGGVMPPAASPDKIRDVWRQVRRALV